MIGRAILTTRMHVVESIMARALTLWSACQSSSISFMTRWTTQRVRFLRCWGLRRLHWNLVKSQFHLLECLYMDMAMGPTPTTQQPSSLLTQISQSHLLAISSEYISELLLNNPSNYFEYHLKTHSLTYFWLECLDAHLQSWIRRVVTTYLLCPRVCKTITWKPKDRFVE